MARPTRRTRTPARPRTRRARGTASENLDNEVQSAVREGRRIDPARAHPEHPGPGRNSPIGPLTDDNGDAPPDRPVADPAAVIASLSSAGGEGYVKEYELRTLHRLLLRNTRLELIARAMDKSVTEIQRLRRTLYRRLRLEAQSVDMVTHAGQTMAFFNEIAAMALRTATDDNVQPITRLAAMREARGAKMDMVNFLKIAGFYSVVKFTPKVDDSDPAAREADNMARMVRAIVDPNLDDASLDELLSQIAAERADVAYLDNDQDTQIL